MKQGSLILNMSSYLILLAGFSCNILQAEQPAIEESLLTQVQSKALIKARVIKIEKIDEGKSSRTTLSVLHVYCNRKEFNDERFSFEASESPQISAIGTPPSFQENDECIWFLKKDTTGKWMPIFYPYLGVRWPVVANSSPRYTQAQALAETMEKIIGSPPSEQLDLLKEYAFSQIPEVSAWAIVSLADCHVTSTYQYLNEIITDTKLSLTGQLTVDERLSEQPGTEWVGSKKRLALQEKWVTSEISEYEASRLISSLDLTYQRKKIDGGVLIHLIDLFVHNDNIPVKERRNAIFLVGRTYKSNDAKEDIFSFLLEQIEHAKEKDLRNGAAYTMRNSIPLSEKQRGIVSELKKKVSDPEISTILNEALRNIQ